MVKTLNPVLFKDLSTTIDQTSKLTLVLLLSQVHTHPSPREVQRINENQTECTSQTSRQQRHPEVLTLLSLRIDALQQVLVQKVLSRKVNSLSREVTHHVRPVTTPQRNHALLTHTSTETVNNT